MAVLMAAADGIMGRKETDPLAEQIMDALSTWLCREMNERRLSTMKLAALCGLSTTQVSRMRDGRCVYQVPSLVAVVKLCQGLGVPLDVWWDGRAER